MTLPKEEYQNTFKEQVPDPRFPLIVACFVIFAGFLTISGWALNIEIFKRPTSGLVAVNPLTAVCFILSGFGVVSLLAQSRFLTKDWVWKGIVVVLFGLCSIKVLNLIFQTDFQIDHVICARQLQIDLEQGKLNSMAPNTALGFLLFAISLALSGRKIESTSRKANLLLLSVFVVGFFSVIGYLYRVGEFKGILAYLPMSFYTAVGFVLLAVALLFTNANSGFMKVINSPYSGGRVARLLIPLIIVIPVLFGYLRLLMETYTHMSTELGISILIACIIVGMLISTWSLILVLNRRDKIQESLAQSQEQFRSAFEYSAIGMALVSTSGRWLSINKKLSEIIGYPKEELTQMTFQDITHPEDLESDVRQVHQLLAGEIDGYQMEKRYFHKDGHLVWALLSVSLVRDTAGRPLHFVSQIENITDRKEAELELNRMSSRLKLATQAAKVGIWEYDIIQNQLVWDPIMYELYGITKETFEGEYEAWRNGIHPDDIERSDSEVAQAIAGEKKFDTEFRVVWPDQSVHHIRALAIVERNEQGEAMRMVGTNWDITADKNYKQALHETTELAEVAKQQALDSAKAKENFLSTMSHEIRTPLNAILGVANLLLMENMKEEQLEHLRLLKFSGENLLTLVNDILDYNKIDAGKIEFEQVDFNLQSLLQSIQKSMLLRIENKALNLELSYDKKVPQFFIGDPVRVSQIVNNLVGNAIKFTEKGKVSVNVTLAEIDHEAARIHFKISDTGIGIEPENQTMIFENFSQASGDTTRKFGGTGLGLAITKRLLEYMGSDIHLESELGKGSTFSFDLSLPLGQEDAYSESDVPGGDIYESLADKGIRILVAEDNKANQIVLEKFLHKWGVQMEFVETGDQAVHLSKSERFDLILMDLQMPVMDGYQATKQVREANTEYSTSIPIIALTASALLDVRKKVKELGMTDYITKPFDPKELYEKILKYHGLVEVKPLANISDNKIFQKLEEYTSGDAAFMEELTDHYLEIYQTFLSDFSALLKTNDHKAVLASCEKIKASNEVLGVQALEDVLKAIDAFFCTPRGKEKLLTKVESMSLEIISDLEQIKGQHKK